MIAEILILMLLALAGGGVVSGLSNRIPAAARITLAVPLGAALYLFTALVALIVTGTLQPLPVLLITAGFGVIGLVASIRRPPRHAWKILALTMAFSAGVAVVTRLVHLTRLTPDSMRYLLAAYDLALVDGIGEMNQADLLNRQIGLPSLHALSLLTDRRYLASLAPAFGASGLGFFAWLIWSQTAPCPRRTRILLLVGGVMFVGASNRLVFDSFYINTHIQVAVYLLIAVAGFWLAVRKHDAPWAFIAGAALAAPLLLRPEAPLVTAVVLVALATTRDRWTIRILGLIPTIAVMGLWYGIVLWNNANGGDVVSLTAPVFGSLAAVAAASLAVVSGGIAPLHRFTARLDRVLYITLFGVLALLGVQQADVLVTSLQATALNIGYHGMWLLTWPVIITLAAFAAFVHRIPEAKMWTVPIMGFSLLFWLLPLLREGPYRIGTGDSGNRVLAHILPVIVAFLIFAAVDFERSKTSTVQQEQGSLAA